MERFRLARWLFAGLSFALVACQPVTRQPEMPALIEYKIPTHSAHAGGIRVGADGAFWFAETGANQIGRITVDGMITEYPIPTEDALADSQGFVALGPDAAIWFNEDGVNKLGRIALNGTVTEFDLPEGTNGIRETVAGPDGNLWVTATDANKIIKLNTQGKVLAEYTLPNPTSTPVGMVLGPDGAFWFIEKTVNQIGRITLEGDITEYAIPTANSAPLRITVGPDNALWFTMASANKIGRISLEGEITEFDVPDMLPVGIAAGADGALWFTGYRSTEIGRLTVDGVLTKITLPTYAAVPYHIVAGPDGNLWFTEQQSNLIGQIKLTGATAAEQKPVVAPMTSSPKNFELPMSVSLDSDWYVLDDFADLVTVASTQKDWELGFNIVTNARLANPLDGNQIAFPEDFVSWIKSNPDFKTDEPTEVMVAGIKGVQVDATPVVTKKKSFLYMSGTTWNTISSPEGWRFILLDDVNGERLLIVLIAPVDQFQGAAVQAQEVLDTVVFSKP